MRDIVHVWCTRTDGFASSDIEASLTVLSPDERQRHDRFVRPDDRRDFAAAHALLRHALSAATAITPEAWRFGRDAAGKPSLSPDQPQLSFNLTHARGLVACVVTSTAQVGVDAEYLDRRVDVAVLAASYLSARERQAVLALSGHEQRRRFLELWTLKEAMAKAAGVGLALPFATLSLDVTADGHITLESSSSVSADWHLELFAPTPSHRLAVAVKSRRAIIIAATEAGGHAMPLSARTAAPS